MCPMAATDVVLVLDDSVESLRHTGGWDKPVVVYGKKSGGCWTCCGSAERYSIACASRASHVGPAFARAQRNTRRCPPSAASTNVAASHGQPFARSH